MSKIKLSNGTTYHVSDYATQNNFVIFLGSLTVTEVLATMTEENLSEIQFLTDRGAVTGAHHNKLLCGHTDNGDTLAVNINDADLCRYGLVLDEDNRIIDAPVQRYAPADAIIVDKLPEGYFHDYLYINGSYVYDPLPEPEQPEPTPTPEERIAQLEAENKTLTAQVDALSGQIDFQEECIVEMANIIYA